MLGASTEGKTTVGNTGEVAKEVKDVEELVKKAAEDTKKGQIDLSKSTLFCFGGKPERREVIPNGGGKSWCAHNDGVCCANSAHCCAAGYVCKVDGSSVKCVAGTNAVATKPVAKAAEKSEGEGHDNIILANQNHIINTKRVIQTGGEEKKPTSEESSEESSESSKSESSENSESSKKDESSEASAKAADNPAKDAKVDQKK